MSCGVDRRHSSDSVLLWLWCRPAAIAPIQSLAWEPPYAEGMAPKKTKNKQKKTHQKTVLLSEWQCFYQRLIWFKDKMTVSVHQGIKVLWFREGKTSMSANQSGNKCSLVGIPLIHFLTFYPCLICYLYHTKNCWTFRAHESISSGQNYILASLIPTAKKRN